jgi:hypothetical protein
MKVLLLALDGLDLDTAKRLSCIQLLQNQYCLMDVPIDKVLKVPRSPTVWASFLAGKLVERYFVNKRLQFLEKIRSHIPLSLGLAKRMTKSAVSFEGKLECETLFDKIENSKAINVPYINNDGEHLKIPFMLSHEEVSLDEVIDAALDLLEKQSLAIEEGIQSSMENDFVFAFLGFPDILEHLCFSSRMETVRDMYFSLNSTVQNIRRMIDKECYFFIMSDHGFNFEEGTHSLQGFFSSNKQLPSCPSSIYELHDLIVELNS